LKYLAREINTSFAVQVSDKESIDFSTIVAKKLKIKIICCFFVHHERILGNGVIGPSNFGIK
jgi:hypothetical protein